MKWKNTFLVGLYKCEMTYSKNQGLNTEWSPDLPRRNLSEQEWQQYRSGRDNLLLEVAKEMGPVMVIET